MNAMLRMCSAALAVSLFLGGVAPASAGKTLPIKEGLYTAAGTKCRVVSSVLEMDEHELRATGKNGAVDGLDDTNCYNSFTKIKRNGNIYTINVKSVPNSGWKGTMENQWNVVVNNEKSFTMDSIMDNVKTVYNYCGAFGESPEPAAAGNDSNSLIAQNPSGLAGTWTGQFVTQNSNGKKYTLTITYAISAVDGNPNLFLFTQVDSLQFINPSDWFECSMKNFYNNSFKGEAALSANKVTFVQKQVSNPGCGMLGTDVYRLDGDRLEVVSVNDGKIRTGALKRNK